VFSFHEFSPFLCCLCLLCLYSIIFFWILPGKKVARYIYQSGKVQVKMKNMQLMRRKHNFHLRRLNFRILRDNFFTGKIGVKKKKHDK